MRRALLSGVVCALALTGSAALAGAASGTTAAGKFSARLTATDFVISQAKSIKLIYRFPKPSKRFSYQITVKKSGTWLLVKKADQKGSFSGQKNTAVRELFRGGLLKVGTYRLELSCDSGRTLLDFKIVPFSGRLTKQSFGIAEARSVKFIYAFSKPSKIFTYQLSVKKGSTWQMVRRFRTTKKKSAFFVGERRASVKSLFGKKKVKLGSYRLRFACSYSNRLLTFKIVTSGPSGSGATATGAGAGGSSGGGDGGGDPAGAMAAFRIAGGVSGLNLGQAKPIVLTLANPNEFQIFVTNLNVTVSANSTPPGCSSADNLRITQSNASNDNPIVVPANGSVTLTSAPRAPQILLIDLPDVNQDACKNASFALSYSGSAHS